MSVVDDTPRSVASSLEDRVRNRELSADKLHWICDPSRLSFETTEDVPALDGTVGQERGVSALAFGLDMDGSGFNLFVSGPPGTGRTTATRSQAEHVAADRPVPSDWCYLFNFDDSTHPIALSLPAGTATQFAQEMAALILAARREISRAIESREYREQQEELHKPVETRRGELVQEISDRAHEEGFTVSVTPAGIAVLPTISGRPMTPDEFEKLSPEEASHLADLTSQLAEQMHEAMEQITQLEKEAHERMVEHRRQVVNFAIGSLLREHRERYQDQPGILNYLDAVQNDIVLHIDEFRRQNPEQGDAEDGEELPEVLTELQRENARTFFSRYTVNVLVDNAETHGAPVIMEPNPTYYNLLGRIEFQARFGSMVTDFRMVKPGALHRANGGFLVLRAFDVLTSPFAWEALKRTLRTREIQIENIGEQFTSIPAATLRPQPIPLDIKVILIGEPLIFYLLYFRDEEFAKLFRVRADFDTEMSRTDEHIARYAGYITSRVARHNLRHFHRSAVAKIVEHGARLSEHQEKLSAQFNLIADLVDEASYWASKDESRIVMAEHVSRAMENRAYRSGLIEDKVQELISEGTLFIDTVGTREGQVNGLSILDLGDYRFGRPVRITAQTALGGEGVLNLERETRLSGPIHNKGFMILTSFLLSRYAQNRPLALAARITFEQTYDEIEGDSASSTELYALLSSLSGLPLRQDIAVTGSVNQLGQIQPVGGVTRKIEGFFEVCKARGLTGSQGVIIPASNVKHLMLHDEVVEAVAEGRFHIWAIETIDEGIEILTGIPAGSRGADGTWEENTTNGHIDRRLLEYAERLKYFSQSLQAPSTSDSTPVEAGPGSPRL